MRRRSAVRVNRTWFSISPAWSFASVTADTQTALMTFENPVTGTLTAQPVEDIIIDRVVGTFSTSLSTLASNWTLGMLVADVGWTVGASFTVDADKRILWHETYALAVGASVTWNEGGIAEYVATTTNLVSPVAPDSRYYRVDITPRVRLQAGKSLFLVAWENSGTGTLSTSSTDMRLLYHRAGRR